MSLKNVRTTAQGVVIEGQMPCDGCGLPTMPGERIQEDAGYRGDVYHVACHREVMLRLKDSDVRIGATRERFTQLKSRIQLGGMDTDTLRAVLLALIDEVMR